MALTADYRDRRSVAPAYYYLRFFQMDRATSLVRVRYEIWQDQAARDAFKAASTDVVTCNADLNALYVADILDNDAIVAKKAQLADATAALNANNYFDTGVHDFPLSAIKSDATPVSDADVYTYLKTSFLANASDN